MIDINLKPDAGRAYRPLKWSPAKCSNWFTSLIGGVHKSRRKDHGKCTKEVVMFYGKGILAHIVLGFLARARITIEAMSLVIMVAITSAMILVGTSTRTMAEGDFVIPTDSEYISDISYHLTGDAALIITKGLSSDYALTILTPHSSDPQTIFPSKNNISFYDPTVAQTYSDKILIGGASPNQLVTGNTVTIGSGITLELTIANPIASVFGGFSESGDVTNNTIILEGKTINGLGLYGARTLWGNATNNAVIVKADAEANGPLYGGVVDVRDTSKSTTGGTVSGNSVIIEGGTVNGDIYGGTTWGIYNDFYSNTADASENSVVIGNSNSTDAEILVNSETIIGGRVNGSGYSKGNRITIDSTEAESIDISVSNILSAGAIIVEGAHKSGELSGNTITISGENDITITAPQIWAGALYNADQNEGKEVGAVFNNSINISNGTFKGLVNLIGSNIVGKGNIGPNPSVNNSFGGSVTIAGGDFLESSGMNVIGGSTQEGNVAGSFVDISGGTGFTNANIAGGVVIASGEASKNTVRISGGDFKGILRIAGGSTFPTLDGGIINTATNNTVIISGGDFTGLRDLIDEEQGNQIVGGYATSDVSNNSVVFGTESAAGIKALENNNPSSEYLSVIGGASQGGNSKDNTVTIFASNVGKFKVGKVFAGLTFTGAATGNTLNILGGVIDATGADSNGELVGGRSWGLGEAGAGGGAVKNNTVNIQGNTDITTNEITGGKTDGSELNQGNAVNISATKVTVEYSAVDGRGEIIGGMSIVSGTNGGNISNNTVTIDGTSTATEITAVGIYGGLVADKGSTAKSSADGNIVDIKSSTLHTQNIVGTKLETDGNATGNKVILNNVTNDSADVNIVGAIINGNGNATNNSVSITGGSFDDVENIIGARVDGVSEGNATGNTITLKGAITGLDNTNIYGGLVAATEGDDVSNNIINISSYNGNLNEVGGVQYFNLTDSQLALASLTIGGTSDAYKTPNLNIINSHLQVTDNLTVGDTSAGDFTSANLAFAHDSFVVVDAKSAGNNTGAINYSGGDGLAVIQNGAKLKILGVVGGQTYNILTGLEEISYIDSADPSETKGWSGDANLISDTPMILLAGSFNNGVFSVAAQAQNANKLMPSLDGSLARIVENAYNTNSNEAGVVFLRNAVDKLYAKGEHALAEQTIESAGRITAQGAVPQMTLMVADAANAAVGQRMSIGDSGGNLLAQRIDGTVNRAAGDFKKNNGLGLWISPIFQHQSAWDLKAGNFDTEWSGDIGGAAVGVDYTIGLFRGGLSFAAGGGFMKGSGDLATTENWTSFWNVGTYVGIATDHFGLRGDVSITESRNNVRQSLPSEVGDLRADFLSHSFNTGILAEAKIGSSVYLLPHAGVRYAYLTSQDFDVKGNGGTVMHAKMHPQNIWSFPVGVTFGGELPTKNGWFVKPSLDFTVIPTEGDVNSKSYVRFTGQPDWAGTQTQMMDRISYKGSAGLDIGNSNIKFGLQYSLAASRHTTTHTGQATFRYDF
jgi:hypothetical protein